MKRVIQHPAPSQTGKQYWRSLGELSDTPEFRDWLEREFPAGAAELEGDDVSRRSFLKLMGASMALAGFGLSSCRKPEMHLVPFTKSAEWVIPGKFLYYATAMPRRNGAMPLVVTTVDGRPIKIEGNPLHPESNGATDAFAQASVLDLYDPSRSKRFVHEKKLADRAAFEKYIAELRPKMATNGGAGSRVSGRGDSFANARSPAIRAPETIPAHALVRLRSAAERGATFFDPNQLRRQYPAHSAVRQSRRRLCARQRFPELRRRRTHLDSRFHVAAPRARGEGLDEPPLRGRESFHSHRRDGGSSPALSGESDPGDHACARDQDRGRDQGPGACPRS